MKFKKIAAILLGSLLVLSLFTGCGGKTVSPLVTASPSASPNASPDEGAASADTLNAAGAYASIEPDTVMLTVNGRDVTWEELFCMYYLVISQIQSQVGQITDWTATISDNITYEDFVRDSAVNYLLQNAAVEYGATETNVTLSDEDKAAIQSDWDTQAEAQGGEDTYVQWLQERYCTKDIFMKLISSSYLDQACFTDQYGEGGSNLTDEEVAEYTADDGYMMAKHILMLTTKTDESGNKVDMTEEEKTQVHEKMQGILDQLKSYDGDDFDAYFDELMTTNSEDPGSISYPDGYLFQSGNMVPEFEDATKALEIGEISDIVETTYGYHIIYRIPLNYDVAPSNGGADSLRYTVAYNMYNATVQDAWLNSLDVTYTDTYNTLDLSKLFAAG